MSNAIDLCTLDDVKGWLDLGGRAITAISKASAAVVTCVAHNLKTGTYVGFSDVAGMTQINGLTGKVTVVDSNSFSVNINSSAFTAYTSGGFIGPDDVILSRMVTAGSKFMMEQCSRQFVSGALTEYYSGEKEGAQLLVTRNSPITAVASLTIDGVAIPASTGYGVAGYGFAAGGYYVYLAGYAFTRGINNIALTYTAGYSTLPYDLVDACVELVGYRYSGRARIGHSSKSLAGETVSFITADMTDYVRDVVKRYSRPMPI